MMLGGVQIFSLWSPFSLQGWGMGWDWADWWAVGGIGSVGGDGGSMGDGGVWFGGLVEQTCEWLEAGGVCPVPTDAESWGVDRGRVDWWGQAPRRSGGDRRLDGDRHLCGDRRFWDWGWRAGGDRRLGRRSGRELAGEKLGRAIRIVQDHPCWLAAGRACPAPTRGVAVHS